MALRAVAILFLLAAAAIALGRLHPFGDPRAATNPPSDAGALLQGAGVPAQAKAVLIAKCADCHSDATRWPVYARIAPVSWLIERDVVEGREHLNLSHWAELPPERRQVLEAKIAHKAKEGDMPPLQYRTLHWGAMLSTQDVQALAAMVQNAGASETAKGAAGDPTRGKAVFEKRCTGCHALDANREGPQLRGVFGRKAGSLAGFEFSAPLKASGGTWDEASLDKWLSDTDAMIPGNAMGFRVPKAQERADVIAFLRQQK